MQKLTNLWRTVTDWPRDNPVIATLLIAGLCIAVIFAAAK